MFVLLATGCSEVVNKKNFLLPINNTQKGLCSNLDSSWIPNWNNLVEYLTLDSSAGVVANGTTISASAGANATALNVNGSGLSYAQGVLRTGLTFDGIDDGLTVPNS